MDAQLFAYAISPIFSGSFLERVARGTHVATIRELSKYYSNFDPPSEHQPLSEWFEFFYSLLMTQYRCEYVFKNLITIKIFLSRHSLSASLLTGELASGRSRADVAILNGTSTAYEIKTEFDSPARLKSQIPDYKNVFDKVYLVSTEAKIKTMKQALDADVGIIVLRNDGSFSVLREAQSNKQNTSPTAVFDCMRQSEYCAAVKEWFGFIPDVPNSRLYTEARELFCTIPPAKAHDLMVRHVRNRGKNVAFSPYLDQVPTSLKHACLRFSKSPAMAAEIFRRLGEPIS